MQCSLSRTFRVSRFRGLGKALCRLRGLGFWSLGLGCPNQVRQFQLSFPAVFLFRSIPLKNIASSGKGGGGCIFGFSLYLAFQPFFCYRCPLFNGLCIHCNPRIAYVLLENHFLERCHFDTVYNYIFHSYGLWL